MLRAHKRLFALIGALFALLLLLTLAYWLGMNYLEDKPRTLWQALQFAAGTTSTTGYGADTNWKHPAMVVFVVVAQLMAVMLIFMVFPMYLIPMLEERFETRLPTTAEDATDHVVIFDYGPTVATLLAELAQNSIPTVIIDEDESQARHLLALGHRVVHGNLDEGVLERSNLARARALIVNGSDDRNAATIITARQLGFKGEILALVEDPFHRQPMMLAGANSAYTPRHVLGAALAARASEKVSPTVAGIQHLGHRLQVAEARITRDSLLAGKTLAEAGIAQHVGVTVIGQWVAGRLIAPPSPQMRLEPGGIVVLLGNDDSIRRCMSLCEGARHLRREGLFVVAGGGEVGGKVAQLLRDAGEQTLVVDLQAGPGVDLVGNVLDTQVLQQAGVDKAQAVILALATDATTLFCAVIIKELAPHVPVIARVNSAENVERIYGAGADFALSISQVSGQLLAMRLLGKESVTVDPDLQVVKVSARGLEKMHPKAGELRERTGCTIVAVERGEALIIEFDGNFAIQANDVVYICGDAQSVSRFSERYPQ